MYAIEQLLCRVDKIEHSVQGRLLIDVHIDHDIVNAVAVAMPTVLNGGDNV